MAIIERQRDRRTLHLVTRRCENLYAETQRWATGALAVATLGVAHGGPIVPDRHLMELRESCLHFAGSVRSLQTSLA